MEAPALGRPSRTGQAQMALQFGDRLRPAAMGTSARVRNSAQGAHPPAPSRAASSSIGRYCARGFLLSAR